MFDSLEYAYGNGCWNNIYGGVWFGVYRIGQTWEKLLIIDTQGRNLMMHLFNFECYTFSAYLITWN